MTSLESIEKLRKWSRLGPMVCQDLLDIADEIEREIAEKYMELPVDADGVPIRIGDELVNNTRTRRATVIGVGAREFFFSDEGRIKKNMADCWTHAKPDKLRERARELLRDYRGLNLKSPDSKLEAILDAFCADVRELMEVRDD